jgi:hypothetical protein
MKETERNLEIARLARETDMTYDEIGLVYGITKQRVQQICIGNPKKNRGQTPGVRKSVHIDVDFLRKQRRAYYLKNIEKLDYEYPIMQDWYDNGLTIKQVCEKWLINYSDFVNINRKWRQYSNYYKKENE